MDCIQALLTHTHVYNIVDSIPLRKYQFPHTRTQYRYNIGTLYICICIYIKALMC